jgi:large subunit ribosomal protein L16
MLRPKQRKFKKHHLYKVGKTVKRKTHLVYGEFGLASEEFSLLSDSQIEVIIMTLKRQLKRKGKL